MPDHQCSQDGRLKNIEEQLGDGRTDFRIIAKDIKQLLQDVSALKAQARIWGAGAAVVVNIIIVLIKVMWEMT